MVFSVEMHPSHMTTQSRAGKRESTAASPYSLLAGGIGLSVILLLAESVNEWLVPPVGRIFHIGFSKLAPTCLAALGLNLGDYLPAALYDPIRLEGVSGLVELFVGALVWHLAAAALACLVLIGSYWIARRTVVGRNGVTRALGTAVLFTFTLPAWSSGHRWFWSELGSPGRHWAATAAAVCYLGVPVLVALFAYRGTTEKLLLSCRKPAAVMAAAAFIAYGAALALSGKPTAEGSPNILLISVDTLRSDHLGCYGYERNTSPNVDRLAEQGALFENAIAPTSWTLPSHATLMTALPISAHRVRTSYSRLASETTLLPEILSDAGYGTAGFVSGSYLDASYGFSQGFDHYNDYSYHFVEGGYRSNVTSPMLTRVATEWLEAWRERGRTRPFFVFVHMWDVHRDYHPPAPYDTLFDPDYQGEVDGSAEQITPEMDPADLRHAVALYDGEIRYADEHIGKMLDVLSRLGELDNTIVAVTGDHGEEFLEHGSQGHRETLYEEVLRVPMIVRFPERVARGVRVSSPVSLMDLGPALLALAGVEAPASFGLPSGGSTDARAHLLKLLRNPAGDELSRPSFGEIVSRDAPFKATAFVRTDRMKLILGLEDNPRLEVYDLVSDPSERQNRAGIDAVAEAALRNQLLDWRKLWTQGVRFDEDAQPDKRQIEALRDLGYIQ